MSNRGLRSTMLFVAGLMGLFGVASAAAASHGTDPRLLGGASAMCLAHAPALLALYAGWAHFRTAAIAALLLAAGTALFAADLTMRHFSGNGLFPMSAPIGGRDDDGRLACCRAWGIPAAKERLKWSANHIAFCFLGQRARRFSVTPPGETGCVDQAPSTTV